MLARDLELTVPEPFILLLPSDWLTGADQHEWFAIASRSSAVAFASRRLGSGYRTWQPGSRLSRESTQTAAEIMVFDALLENSDRREDNPNCLIKGSDIRIIDHELAFSPERIGPNWRPPWHAAGLRSLRTPGEHIFRRPMDASQIDWEVIERRWRSVSDKQLEAYARALPNEWQSAVPALKCAVATVKMVRDQIGRCLSEIRRVLRRPVDAGPSGPLYPEEPAHRQFIAPGSAVRTLP